MPGSTVADKILRRLTSISEVAIGVSLMHNWARKRILPSAMPASINNQITSPVKSPAVYAIVMVAR